MGSKSLPGARRSPSSARRKAPPFGCYANFEVRLQRVRGLFRWVRVTYGATRSRRSRRKRNVVKTHECLVGRAAETAPRVPFHTMRPAVTTRHFWSSVSLLLPTVSLFRITPL
ncbi:hypothetical protein TNCT_687681 [Trichonephila clavata]|uniref:Uncharacterized protein n=1 Tax=Trichonephila clavata TaxID=2740835 RepID=A0A8X6IPD0_TRICU|nr:hypothetical protein TNCT_687681 [Trichonephila clavata]